ncbi:hypothetical protein [Spongiactinospora sp. 9N601]|uniref:hypothetical protein n=1 Tax=Spongiactinospora sp. 9N601 TaxID=3375149 RepID=UPI0037967AA7
MPKSSSCRVVDAHRLAGPVPFDDLPEDPRPEMDRLGIEAAWVTHTLSLYADAQDGNDALLRLDDPRLIPVPVVLPGVPGADAPDRPRDVAAWGVRMVRLCPARHRFELTGPAALDWLAELGLPVAIDFAETSPGELRAVAGLPVRAVPRPEGTTADSRLLLMLRLEVPVDRDFLLRAMAAEGVPLDGGYPPLGSLPALHAAGVRTGPCPAAGKAAAEVVWVRQSMLMAEPGAATQVAEALAKVLPAASR